MIEPTPEQIKAAMRAYFDALPLWPTPTRSADVAFAIAAAVRAALNTGRTTDDNGKN
jgi:hypothetical protein